MIDEEKQIEEMAKVIHFDYWGTCAKDSCSDCPHNTHNICKDKIIAEKLYDKLLPEGSVVLSKEEHSKLVGTIHRLQKYDEERDIALHARLIAKTRKETAREILNELLHSNLGTTTIEVSSNHNKEDIKIACQAVVGLIKDKIKELAKQFGVEVEK